MLNRKQFLMMIMLFIVCTFLTSCQTERGQIKNTLTDFQQSCKNGDVEGVLDCLDPDLEIVKLLKTGAGLTTLLTGEEISINDIVDQMIGSEVDIGDSFENISIKKPKCKIYGEEAKVTCTIVYDSEEEHSEEEIIINMKKKYDTWYIAGFGFE